MNIKSDPAFQRFDAYNRAYDAAVTIQNQYREQIADIKVEQQDASVGNEVNVTFVLAKDVSDFGSDGLPTSELGQEINNKAQFLFEVRDGKIGDGHSVATIAFDEVG
jgi:hypothetical protein